LTLSGLKDLARTKVNANPKNIGGLACSGPKLHLLLSSRKYSLRSTFLTTYDVSRSTSWQARREPQRSPGKHSLEASLERKFEIFFFVSKWHILVYYIFEQRRLLKRCGAQGNLPLDPLSLDGLASWAQRRKWHCARKPIWKTEMC